jgi:uncharacterized protein YecE (DUF72 family)
MTILAGTSGYSYTEWKGFFYPEKLPSKEFLKYYATQLPTVEINNTFYRLPNPEMVENWADQVPENFRFSLKASQRITHIKRLKDAREEAAYFIKMGRLLKERLGVILFQMPPYFKKDVERLQNFLKLIPGDIRAAFEFRHESWFEQDVFDALRDTNCSLCIADTEDEMVPFVATADWGYVRLRRENYTKPAISKWMKNISNQKWETAFVFFKHEGEGVGAKLALDFLKLVGTSPKRGRKRKT